jgi:hypothetical protein
MEHQTAPQNSRNAAIMQKPMTPIRSGGSSTCRRKSCCESWANGYSYLNVAKGDGSGISSLRVRICCLDGLIYGSARCAVFRRQLHHNNRII